MKMKKKAVIAAAAFAVAMNLSACAYGPPEDYEDTPQTEEITSFDPAENQTVGVYGPPSEEEWEYDETDTSEEEQNVGEEALNNE
ncbi:MAG: hypothetical protein K2J76_08395 [Oscillospiraceae bacterium]|nr:hypothetical protein [Oscillospiraceae bacterium]